jgi:sugar phosphate isomerase/epimerase
LAHLTAQAELARSEGVVLLHENEKEIYGDVPERVLDLVTAVDSPALRLAWDNANFVQVGIRPFTDGWAELAPYVEYLQVKDARMSDGAVTPAGEGDGELVQTLTALRDAGFDGFASLEPHLAVAGRMGGFSGPGAFGRAARALRRITDALGIELI